MDSFAEASFAFILVGAAFFAGVMVAASTTTYDMGVTSKALIEQCEKDLLRTQFCELVALPKEK